MKTTYIPYQIAIPQHGTQPNPKVIAALKERTPNISENLLGVVSLYYEHFRWMPMFTSSAVHWAVNFAHIISKHEAAALLAECSLHIRGNVHINTVRD